MPTPTPSFEPVEIAAAIIKAIKNDQPIRSILLAGPPGVGKTFFGFEIGKHLKKKYIGKVQHHAEGSVAEILGMYVPDEKSFRWESGPLDLAYSMGGLLILDEIIEAAGPVKTMLYGALDDGPGGTISYVGRTFTPHPEYMVIATMNGWPHEGGLPEALLDRFDAVFPILRPSKKQLALLDPDLRLICIESYETAKDPMLGPNISFRMLRSLQKLRSVLPLEKAVLASCQGNQVQAAAFMEVLALTDEEDEDDLEDEEASA